MELLLVNNNSDDRSIEIAKKYQQMHPDWIFMLNESSQGVVHAMNAGLRKAQFDWIARMDADDEWLLGKLQAQLDFVAETENSTVQVVGTQVQFASRSKAAEGFSAYVDWSNRILSQTDINQNIFCESPLVNPSALFHKELVAQYGFYKEGDFPEDYEMFLRWHSNGVKMAKLGQVLMVWNDSNTRLTRSHPAYEPEAFNRIKCFYLAKWLKAHTRHSQNIWIWGAGRKTRKKLEELEKHGIAIEGFIDLNANKTSIKPCVAFTEIEKTRQPYVVSFVSNRGKGNEIRQYLKSKSFIELEDFIIAG